MKIPFRNITISGEIGTGKSTLAKNLANKLGWRYLNAGDILRKWHKDHGIPINDTDKVPPDFDREIDFGFKEMMRTESNIIFESRLAGWLAKEMDDVFKILCITDFDVAVTRISKREGVSKEQASLDFKLRSKALAKKLDKLYRTGNFLDERIFNLILDTTNLTPQECLEEVLKKLT